MSLQKILPTLVAARDLLLDLDDRLRREDRDRGLGLSNRLQPFAAELSSLIETAERAFTVAVVGEFKVGKSTLLNGLLGLSGEAALSAQDSPDTARSILLRERQPGLPEARLHFDNGAPAQDVSWAEAKRLTSQVSLEQDPDAALRARQLQEVEYFAPAPLLGRFHFNDLPGTGAHHRLGHTRIAHDRMKLADAVLWVVAGDREPAADARQDLAILAQYSQKVLPVVNVIEDPSADPPIPRELDLAREIAQAVTREFRGYFSPLVDEPLLVSARVLEIERAREQPDPAVLEDTGYDALILALEQLLQSHDRSFRLSGAASATLDRALALLTEITDRVERLRSDAQSQADAFAARLEEIGSVQTMLRGQIATLARARAESICRRISQQGQRFVDAQLDVTNVKMLFQSLSSKGRQRLSDELSRDFEKHYLRLGEKPSWLDVTLQDFTRDVSTLIMPEWRRIARSYLNDLDSTQREWGSPIDMETLGADLQRSMISICQRLLLAGGGSVIVLLVTTLTVGPVLLVACAALPVFGNPFEKRRRQARERVRAEIEMQQDVIASQLHRGAWESAQETGDAVRAALEGDQESSASRLQEVSSLCSALMHGMDRLRDLRDGMERRLDPGGEDL